MYYLHSRLCLLTALIEYLTVQTRWQGTENIWQGLDPARRPCLSLCMAYNSGIILTKIVTYYS